MRGGRDRQWAGRAVLVAVLAVLTAGAVVAAWDGGPLPATVGVATVVSAAVFVRRYVARHGRRRATGGRAT